MAARELAERKEIKMKKSENSLWFAAAGMLGAALILSLLVKDRRG